LRAPALEGAGGFFARVAGADDEYLPRESKMDSANSTATELTEMLPR